MYRMTSW
jgi:hypothetical protein